MAMGKINPFDQRESSDHIVYRKMALFISSCWFHLANFILFLIKCVARHVLRIKMEGCGQKSMKDYTVPLEPTQEAGEIEERGFSGFDEDEEEETSGFSFKFDYQNPKVSAAAINDETLVSTTRISNYRFLSERDFGGFVEEPGAVTFQVHESFIANSEDKLKPSTVMFSKDEEQVSESSAGSDTGTSQDVRNPMVSETMAFDKKEAIGSSSDSTSSSDGYSVKNLEVGSESEGFLSENDFVEKERLLECSTFEMELAEDMERIEEEQSSDLSGNIFCDGFLSETNFTENVSPRTDELWRLDENGSENKPIEVELELKASSVREIDKTQLPSSSKVQIELMDSSDDELQYSKDDRSMSEDPNVHTEVDISEHLGSVERSKQADEAVDRAEEKYEETQFKDLAGEELDELESIWEHQDLIEQLKMELKRVRAIGLPTIFEESESPKTMEDLKPWKIDEKFLREDPMDELHKFYKSYRERMRKFDILNYQKMYAIGFLHLKNPLESMATQKPLISTILSHFSQSWKPLHRRKSSTDPSEKFMQELQVDLETVYVGQMCLSWEFLRWQYEKARELPDSDPYRTRQYNQVAGEFQQFQVIIQRFIENESFQGPRLQNYVKNRCVLRNLLQVPVVKEDCLNDRKEEKRKGHYAITSEMLEDIMEESIRVFWDFVKADKDETSIILKGLIGNQVELQDPSDFELVSEIQASLQKKEKKLKDILKTGNCLVKKFKKPREDRSNQDLFFSQVDMKLISRVLKMSRIATDQLVWCHKKLSKITFADRKIHREPSFLLFPC